MDYFQVFCWFCLFRHNGDEDFFEKSSLLLDSDLSV